MARNLLAARASQGKVMVQDDEARADDFTLPCVLPTRPRDGARVSTERAELIAWVSRLVHTHRTSLARIAQREGLPPDLAFDAVHEAFVTFMELPKARPLIDEPEGSRKLLVTLVRNVARNARRRHGDVPAKRHDPDVLNAIAIDTASVDALIAAAEDHVRLAGCLRTLAEVPRTVVTLRMLDEMPGEDVARTLGLSPNHVAVLLHRARSTLLACMTGDDRATETRSLPSVPRQTRRG